MMSDSSLHAQTCILDVLVCTLCPRACQVDRSKQTGFCGIGDKPVLAKAFPHLWEEPCISGTKGSGTVFFSGCSLKCLFCQNRPISHGGIGREMNTTELAAVFMSLQAKGVHNINLVNPIHQAQAVAEAIDICGDRLKIRNVWNSGGYDAVQTIRAMASRISVWLPDLKFMDATLSGKLALAPDYFEHASAAILGWRRALRHEKGSEA